MVADTARLLIGQTEPQAVMDEVMRRLHEYGFEHASLYLLEGEELARRASRGKFEDLLPANERIPPGHGIIGYVGQTARTLLANNVAAEARFVPLPGAAIAAELAVPLRRGEVAIGVLNVESERQGAFSAEDVHALEILADLLATALQTGELLAELRASERLATALRRVGAAVTASLNLSTVLDTLCRETIAALEVDQVEAWLLDREGRNMRPAAVHGPQVGAVMDQTLSLEHPSSVAVRAVRERRSILAHDMQRSADGVPALKQALGTQALLAAPILTGGRPLGALILADARNPQRFDRRDAAAAELLGAQAAIAIQNARLFEETVYRAQQIALLNAITGAALEATGTQQLQQMLADRLGALISADGCYITEWDEEHGRTIPAAAYGALRESYPASAARPGETTLTESVLRAGRPLVVEDVFNSSYLSPHIAARFPTRSLLGLPLIAGEQKLGAALIGFDRPHHFTETEITICEHAARQVAMALVRARLVESEQRQRRRAEALLEAARALNSTLELPQILDQLLAGLALFVPYDSAAVLLVEGGRYRVASGRGFPDPDAIAALRVATEEDALLVEMQRTQQPLVLANAGGDPRFHGRAGTGYVRGWMGVPLISKGEVIGALTIDSRRPGVYGDAEAEIAFAFASHAATAIENARLYQSSKERAAMLAALYASAVDLGLPHELPELLETVVERAVRLLGASAGGLYLCEPEQQLLRCVASYQTKGDYRGLVLRYGEGAAGAVALSGKPLVVGDYSAWPGRAAVFGPSSPFRSVLSAPMTWQGEVTGVIQVLHDEPHRFTPTHLELLTQFGAHAAVAVQNTRLLAETRRYAEEQRLLFDAARDFSAGLDEAGTLKAIARHVARALNALHCVICRRDRAADELITLLDYDLTTGRAQANLPGGACILSGLAAGRDVLETGLPLVVRAGDRRADPAGRGILKEHNFERVLIMPLAGPQHPFGLISAFRDSGQPDFSEAEVELGQSLAAQAAVALENVSLHAAERQRARELDALLTANGALLSTLELEPLLHNVLAAALEAIPAARKGAILLLNRESQLLECRAIIGYHDPRVPTSSFPPGHGYSARAMREARPLLIGDARADPAIRYDGEIEEMREILAAVVAPLRLHNGQSLGVISLDATVRAAFDPNDLRLLEAFANTAAVAIDHARLHAEVQQSAITDSLTGLANRRAFDSLFHAEVARAARYRHPLSLIFADVDDFKAYNDTRGHPAGDERLRAVARLLEASVRHPDVAARYGGEEFVLVLPHTERAGAAALAERIRAAAEAAAPGGPAGPQECPSPGSPVAGYTLSLGVAAFPQDGASAGELLQAADDAELAAKRAGKNRVVVAGAS